MSVAELSALSLWFSASAVAPGVDRRVVAHDRVGRRVDRLGRDRVVVGAVATAFANLAQVGPSRRPLVGLWAMSTLRRTQVQLARTGWLVR